MRSVEICREVVSAAEEIHLALGPTLFRQTYTMCLALELSSRGFQVQTKHAELTTGGVDHVFINGILRVDILTDNSIAENEKHHSVRVRKGSSRPINLSLNFSSPELLDRETKETLFDQIISIADVSPYPPSGCLQ